MSALVSATCLLWWATIGGSAETLDATLFRQWRARLDAQLQEMPSRGCTCGGQKVENMEGWLQDHCTMDDSGCVISIDQDMQWFGRFRHVSQRGTPESLEEKLQGVQHLFAASRLEMEHKVRQLGHLIDFLEQRDGAEPFTNLEIEAQATLAAAASESADGSVEVSLGRPRQANGTVMDDAVSCSCGRLTKPLSMCGNQAVALDNPKDAAGVTLTEQADLTSATTAGASLAAVSTAVNDQYAAGHLLLTYLYLYFPSAFILMTPVWGSGPQFPQGSSVTGAHSSACGWLPWSRMFGPHVSCASPAQLLFGGWPTAFAWFESSPYGLLTFSPVGSRQSSCWMIPFVGMPGGLISGRPVEDRTFFGSHPCGLSSSAANNPDAMNFLANKYAYDERLVSMLYELEARNASFTRVTFFTTQLQYLALLGWNPKHAALQHHGVQLTLEANASLPSVEGPVYGTGSVDTPRVLTLEMMSEGLLWTLRSDELDRTEVHSYEAYTYDRIRPAVVADYVVDQKRATYTDGNCQVFAKNLMDRVLAHSSTGHGQETTFAPSHVSRVLGDVQEITNRARMLLACTLLVVLVGVSVQSAVVWRVTGHVRAGSAAKKGLVRHTAEMVVQDFTSADEWATELVGNRLMMLVRGWVMFSWPPALWYWAYFKVSQWRESRKIASDGAAFLLG